MASVATTLPAGTRRATRPGPARRRRTPTAFLFLAPFLVLFTAFVLVPAVYGIVISLHTWNPMLPVKPFVGGQNYLDLFTPGSLTFADFWQSMGVTGIFTVCVVPFLLVIPMGLALLLNKATKATTFFRAVYFAPYVLGIGVVGVMFKYLLDAQNGAVNSVLGALGLPSDIPWTVDMPWAMVSIILVTVWWTAGFNTIILLAGLQGISRELYDAAAVDGAGPWRSFTAVTLPGLRPVLKFVTTTTILASANLFGQSFLMTQGHPGNSTRSAIMYIADQGLSQNQMGAASAMSYILFVFLAVISIINFRLQRESTD